MNKFAKCIVAGVTAGFGSYEAAGGGTSGAAVVAAIVAMVATGVITWGVPNAVATDVRAATDAVVASERVRSGR